MQNEKTDLNKTYQTLLLIWGALLVSQFVFLLIIFFVRPEVFNFDFSQPIGGKQPAFVMALAVVSLVNFFLSFMLRKQYLAEAVRKQEVGLVQTGMIISCALGESITIFGVMLVFMQSYRYFFLFFALGILAILLSFPRRDDVMAAGVKKV